MEQFKIGDKLMHTRVPADQAAVLTVLKTRKCGELPHTHLAYRVTDPEGTEDWVCAYDLRPVAS